MLGPSQLYYRSIYPHLPTAFSSGRPGSDAQYIYVPPSVHLIRSLDPKSFLSREPPVCPVREQWVYNFKYASQSESLCVTISLNILGSFQRVLALDDTTTAA